MQYRQLFLGIIALALGISANAESPATVPWGGVWQGQLDGQPGVILTLAEDTGTLGGTVVFNMVSREGGQAHVIGSDAHILLDPQVNGDTLNFKVKRTKDGRELDVAVKRASTGSATIQILRCNECPVAELTKSR